MARTQTKPVYTPAENRYDQMPYRRCGTSGRKLPRSAGPRRSYWSGRMSFSAASP